MKDKLERGDICILNIGYIANMPIIKFADMVKKNQIDASREITRSEIYVFYEGRIDLVGKEVVVVDVINDELIQVKLDTEYFTVLKNQLEYVKTSAQLITFNKPLITKAKNNVKKPKTIKPKATQSFFGDRKEQIEACEKCNGNPILEYFKIPHTKGDFEGERCVKCWLIKSYKNV